MRPSSSPERSRLAPLATCAPPPDKDSQRDPVGGGIPRSLQIFRARP